MITSATKRWILLGPAIGALLYGCAVSTDSSVTVTPPVTTGKVTTVSGAEVELPGTIAMLPFVNRTDSEFAYRAVRRTMFNHFSSKNYRMVHWRDVDRRLQLANHDDPAATSSLPVAEIAGLLGVDGIIYGDVTHYDKTFAGVISQISVGVQLRLVSADGETIWTGEDVKRSRAGGVSTSPVGLLMNALVAAKHLYGDLNLYRTADDLGRDLAAAMPEPPALAQRKKPRIQQVVHSGVGKYLKYGDTLEIGIEGDPGLTAAARIDGIGVVDLEEVESGQYIGRYAIGVEQQADDVVVTGVLQDDFGQTSAWISPYGLLNVDNQAPGSVQALSSAAKDRAVQLSWQGPADSDVVSYAVALARSERGAADSTHETEDPSYLLASLTNFEPVYVSVTAIDRAGNAGEPTRLATMAAPDPRFGAAADLASVLPTTISGVARLTRAGSPYYLRSASRVASDGVLLVSPGVEIHVSPKVKLSVLGELQMYGESAAPIVVSDENSQGFESFLVLQSELPVQIRGIEINGGGTPIEILAGRPLISDCRIAGSQFNAMSIAGSSRPTIRDCEISGAKMAGVSVLDSAQPTLTNNRFVNNDPFHIQNGSTYPVDAKQNQWQPAASQSTILGDVTY